jgi:hypothetical protein
VNVASTGYGDEGIPQHASVSGGIQLLLVIVPVYVPLPMKVASKEPLTEKAPLLQKAATPGAGPAIVPETGRAGASADAGSAKIGHAAKIVPITSTRSRTIYPFSHERGIPSRLVPAVTIPPQRRNVNIRQIGPPPRRRLKMRLSGNSYRMDFATVAIVFGLVVFLPAALVGGLFVWAALKDGEEDRAVQKWLGIRRRTRLGR